MTLAVESMNLGISSLEKNGLRADIPSDSHAYCCVVELRACHPPVINGSLSAGSLDLLAVSTSELSGFDLRQ